MSRPNILFIMDDQHRFDYLGVAGAGFVRTPNIDALATSGVRFTQCTTNAPVCAPSRIGLASGLHPCRLGDLDNASFLPPDTTSYDYSGYRVGLRRQARPGQGVDLQRSLRRSALRLPVGIHPPGGV